MAAVHPGDDQQRLIAGRYRLSAQLGSGAMGTVYEAFDPLLRRRVAIKLVRPDHILTKGMTARRSWVLRVPGSDHRAVLADFDVTA